MATSTPDNPNVCPRIRQVVGPIGVMPTGPLNAITDVAGVRVGHVTLCEPERGMHTGVTAILPHEGNIFQSKVPAAVYVGNGFGKMAGLSQIQELGNLESPIVLTNTLNVAAGLDGILDYLLALPGNETVKSINAVVGETNDGAINDIRRRFVTKDHVLQALRSAQTGPVAEGCVGAGTGTKAFGLKGGIGTSSRVLSSALGGYTVGVLVQANFGGLLTIKGHRIRAPHPMYAQQAEIESPDGSIMMIVATDAPLDSRNLARLAKRSFMGMATTGGIASNGSGDYVIAFSTAPENRISHVAQAGELLNQRVLRNEDLTGLFVAAIEATAEAIYNALIQAVDTVGYDGTVWRALSVDMLAPCQAS